MSKRLAIFAVCGVIAIGVAMGIRVAKQWDPMPIVAKPALATPNPNGYEILLALSEAIKDAQAVRTASSEFRAILDRKKPTDKAEQILKDNALLFPQIEDALRLGYQPPLFDSLVPDHHDLNQLKLIGYLLHLRAAVAVNKRDWKTAVEAYVHLLRLSARMASARSSTDVLMAETLAITAVRTCRQLISELPNRERAKLLLDLQEIESGRATFATVLSAFHNNAAYLWAKVLEHGDWRAEVEFVVEKIASTNFGEIRAMLGETSRKQFMDGYLAYAKWQDDVAAQPYFRQYSVGLPKISSQLQLLFASMDTDYIVRTVSVRERTNRYFLQIQLALSLYLDEHQGYPDKLDQLMPKYLKQSLIDPFSAGWKFRYVNSGDRYLLYSVGPDGDDDLGTPLVNDESGVPSKGLTPETLGDYLADL